MCEAIVDHDGQRDLLRLDHEVGLLQHTEKLIVELDTRKVDINNKLQVGRIAKATSKRMSSACVDHVPALCTYRPSLLPIEWLSEASRLSRRIGGLGGVLSHAVASVSRS